MDRPMSPRRAGSPPRVPGFPNAWIGLILALAITPELFAQPANDDCANAIAVVQGDIAFSTVGATTDGTDLVGFCDMGIFGDDNAYNDIWLTYTAIATGDVFLSTCNQADYDTRLAVYSSTACPADAADVIGCNDDVAGCDPFTSEMTFAATAGSTCRCSHRRLRRHRSGPATAPRGSTRCRRAR